MNNNNNNGILNKQLSKIIVTVGVSTIAFYYLLDYCNSKYHLKQRFFNNVWQSFGPNIDRILTKRKKVLFGEEAYGKVLDIGSGEGPTFKYLSNHRENDGNMIKKVPISEVIAIEPNPFMLSKLTEAANRVSPEFDVKIISKTIQEALESKELEYESFDTVICNLVLCSIPNQQSILNEIYKLLKPGGKFLFIEHVCSDNKLGELFQTIINPIWGLIFDGCQLTHHTDTNIINMNGWEKVTISRVKELHNLKHIYGYAIKDIKK